MIISQDNMYYYLDMDEYLKVLKQLNEALPDEMVTTKEVIDKEGEKGRETIEKQLITNTIRNEVVALLTDCLRIVLADPIDFSFGDEESTTKSKEENSSYIMAYNTLRKYRIITTI